MFSTQPPYHVYAQLLSPLLMPVEDASTAMLDLTMMKTRRPAPPAQPTPSTTQPTRLATAPSTSPTSTAKEPVLAASHHHSGTPTADNVWLAHQLMLLMFRPLPAHAQLPPISLMLTTDVSHATCQDIGTQPPALVWLALQDSSSKRLPSPASALQPLHILAPTISVSPATPLTTGTSPQEPAYHALLTPIGMQQLLSVSAALKDSLLILQDLDALVDLTSHTMMLPTRSASNATFPQFGMRPRTCASAVQLDPLSPTELVFAQLILPSLMFKITDVRNAPSTYPFGMAELVLLAQLELTTTVDQRPAQFALKVLATMPLQENAI